jgi:hypothetical protein
VTEVVAALVAYGDNRTVSDAIRTITPWVDRIVLVSAPFVGRPPLGHADTTVRTVRRAVGSIPLDAEIGDRPVTEVEARNRAIEMVGSDNAALVIDADEILLAESTAIGQTALGKIVVEARQSSLYMAYGITIYTTAVLFRGAAPDIDRHEYRSAPMVASCGVQPRLFRARDAEYRPSVRGAPGLFIANTVQRPGAVPGAVIVNHRVRQSWEGYQADYAWEKALER